MKQDILEAKFLLTFFFFLFFFLLTFYTNNNIISFFLISSIIRTSTKQKLQKSWIVSGGKYKKKSKVNFSSGHLQCLFFQVPANF